MELSLNTTLLLLTALVAIPNFLYYLFSSQISRTFQYRAEVVVKQPACIRSNSKWIVITSIALTPTKAIENLSSEREWNIVVVGDTKGPFDPLPLEWSELPNVCVLTVETQKRLNFLLLKMLPYRSYTRKMIGYLHAIKHGAEWVYDTDDDNHPINKGLLQFDTSAYQGMAYINVTRKGNFNMSDYVFNPYEYFGQPGMWPRGHPLSQIRIKNDVHQHRLCQELPYPAIQQGLVDKDPDVDAIYRLLNADAVSGLNTTFSSIAPPIVVGPGIYTPFNSQNTLFHKNAFFGLFLPVTVAFRVTDIWRGYFAQKLLHLTGNFIGFYPVNARQVRNPHSYLDDFKEEKALYYETEKVIDLLAKWKCSKNNLADCAIELSELFVANGFWRTEENDVLKMWLYDLDQIGYNFPPLTNSSSSILFGTPNCRRSYLNFNVEDSPEKRQLMKNKNLAEIVSWCNEAAERITEIAENISYPLTERISSNRLEKRALIITSNYQLIATVGLLDRMYDGYFAHVVFCGPFYPQFVNPTISGYKEFPAARKVSFIHLYEREMHEGFFAYYCTTKAIELRLQNVEGYIVIADDAVYNFWNHIELNRFRLNGVTRRKGTWWSGPYGEAAINATIQDLQNRLSTDNLDLKNAWNAYDQALGNSGIETIAERDVWGVADWYYLPSANASVFYELSKVFFENGVFHEIAVPKFGAGLGWLDFYKSESLDVPNSLHVWFKRSSWAPMYHENLIYFHPVKMSSFGKTLSRRFDFCRTVIAAFAKNLMRFRLTSYEQKFSSSNETIENPVLECCQRISSLSRNCLHLCNIQEINARKIYELLTATESSCKMDSRQMSHYINCFTSQSGNATIDDSLESPKYLPPQGYLEEFSNTTMTTPQIEVNVTNSLEQCCFKRYVYRASRGKNCFDFCTGHMDLARIETGRYVTCVEVLTDIIECYGRELQH